MRKKIISWLLVLAMCLTMLPTAAFAAEAAGSTGTAAIQPGTDGISGPTVSDTGSGEKITDYASELKELSLSAAPAEPSPVYVSGVQLMLDTNYVNDNGSVRTSGDSSWNAKVTGSDAEGYVLTLNGLSVTGTRDNGMTSFRSSAIYTEAENLKVVVEGDSTVTGADADVHSAGIYAQHELTITGSGTLTAVGGSTKTTLGYSDSYGIKCNGKLILEDTTLIAKGGTAGESSAGVFAASITITGDNADITAVGRAGNSFSYGMGASEKGWLNGGRVDVRGEKKALHNFSFGTTVSSKEVKYTDDDNNVSNDYNSVSGKEHLIVTLGDPAPVFRTVWFYTNGGKLSGSGVKEITPGSLYTMQYQVGKGMELPSARSAAAVTRENYVFTGWYDNSSLSGGRYGSIGEESNRDHIFYAKWESPKLSDAVIHLGKQGIYNGSTQSVAIDSVTFDGQALKQGVDYEIVSGGTATNVESTTLTIRGKGAYTGEQTIEWSLLKASPSLKVDFAQSVLDTLSNGVDYTGSAIRIETPLKDGKSGMGKVTTYYEASGSGIAFSAAKDAGKYSVIFSIEEGQNYNAASLMVGTLTVHKVDYPGEKAQSVTVRYDKKLTDITVTLPALPDSAVYGIPELGSAHYADGRDYPYSVFSNGQRGIEGSTLYLAVEPVSEAGIYADVTIPVTGAKNYHDYSITVRVTRTERTDVRFSGIEDNQSFPYDGTAKTPAGTLRVSGNVDVDTLEVQYARIAEGVSTPISGAPTDVGRYLVTYSVPDSNNEYRGRAAYVFTITPRAVTVSGITAESKTYDGTTDAALNGDHAVFTGMVDGDTLTVTADGTFENASAGENKTVNITHLVLGGADAGNYELAEANQQTTAAATIRRAAISADRNGTLTVSNSHAYTYRFHFGTLLPTLERNREYGTAAYSVSDISLGSYYADGAVIDADGILTLPITKNSTAAEGKIGTVTVTVSTTNYEDFTLTLNVSAANKGIPAGEPKMSKTELTYGEKLSTITLSGTMKDGTADVPGTFAWSAPETVPNAGSYAAGWVFTPDDQLHYAAVNGYVTITVHKAAQAAPATPGLESRTKASITLKAIADNANGAKAQYRVNGGEWQNSPTFTGLRGGTEYTFEARYAATADYEASPVSTTARFSTKSGSRYTPSGSTASRTDAGLLSSPQTGDSSALGLWGFTLCSSLAACLVLTTVRLRRRKREGTTQITKK